MPLTRHMHMHMQPAVMACSHLQQWMVLLVPRNPGTQAQGCQT